MSLTPASLIPVANLHCCQQHKRNWWQNLPPVSLIPVANLPPVSLILVANLPPVSLILVANLPPVSLILVANLPPVKDGWRKGRRIEQKRRTGEKGERRNRERQTEHKEEDGAKGEGMRMEKYGWREGIGKAGLEGKKDRLEGP